MLNTSSTVEEVTPKHVHVADNESNILEDKITEYKTEALRKIKFGIILKPALISLAALFISFFLDLSYVPILGNISIKLATAMFPGWQPAAAAFQPYSFWWLPVIVYLIFLGLAYGLFLKLKHEVLRSPTTDTIDKITSSYITIVDSVAMSLPLIGAAILLISIKLGEEVFLGLSVPFEVKALVILAIGKLFEPVMDQIGLEFQNIVDHIQITRERYYSQLQVRNSKTIVKQLSMNQNNSGAALTQFSAKEAEQYKDILAQTSKLSEVILTNFNSVANVLEKINNLQQLSGEKIDKLKELANSINQASVSLSDEKTVTGLKYLESIVKK